MAAITPELLESLFKPLTDGICVSDLSRGILYMNPAAERMLETSLAEARGQSLCDVLCARLSVQGSSECKSACGLLADASRVHAATFVGRHGIKPAFHWKGEGMQRVEHWKNLRVRCLEMGKMHLTIIEDASAEVEFQRQKEDWRSMLVHDLRSPLSNVYATLRAWQELSAKGAPPDPTLLGVSLRSCRRMLELLDLYLDIAKLEAGSMPVKPARVDAAELARREVEEQIPSATSRGIRISIGLPKRLDAIADETLLSRVLQNLINNAIKFTPEGGSIVVSGRAVDQNRIELSVKDTGPGIDPQEIPRLFDRFQQAQARRRGHVQGTGLGLSFCKEALGAMRGEIEVESAVGRGSRFVIILPNAAGISGSGAANFAP